MFYWVGGNEFMLIHYTIKDSNIMLNPPDFCLKEPSFRPMLVHLTLIKESSNSLSKRLRSSDSCKG
jgi:hypothetical protein